MKDKYIRRIEKAAIDDDISHLVNRVTKSEIGGKPMVVAIKNEQNEIYRVITTSGLNTYLMLVNGIAKMGLTDLHVDNLHPGEYDSLFVFHKR